MTRLCVIGVGKIGGEVAFLASVLGLVDELILNDTYAPLLEAQQLDLLHTGLDIEVSTDSRAAESADICLFAAGFPRNPSIKTRADLLSANLPVADAAVQMLSRFDGILITVTNPMDANNYYLCKKSGIDRHRCIGFGGQLDSARFNLALAERCIPGESWVFGEHGEHQVPFFGKISAGVLPDMREEILTELRGSSMEVINGKGGTVFGPAYHITDMIRQILQDSRQTIPCSCVLDGEYGFDRCSLGVPAQIGKEGIRTIEEWPLDGWEQQKFNEAGAFVQGLCEPLDF